MTYKKQFNRKFKQPLDKSNSKNDIKKLTGIKRIVLNRIYDRGIGAYRTNPKSVRPQVKSEEQWAMARVYSTIMNYYHWKKTGKEKGAFKYDRDIFEKYQKNLIN
jgi:hypothetical protein